MQSNEQQLIESLFTRLKQAASQSAPRDAAAEQLIQQQAQQVPAAPYYMAQAILIQEAAMKQLNSRVAELEAQLAQARQAPPQQSNGGFLSGLFGGGGNRQNAAQSQSAWGSPPPQQPAYNPPPQQPAQAAPRGTGFLGGALQTAVGVAGGVVMADMLTSMFHQSQPQEIVNIINEPPMPQQDFDASDTHFLDQGQGADWQNTDYSSDNFNGFGNDSGFDDNNNTDSDFDNDYGNDYDDDSFI